MNNRFVFVLTGILLAAGIPLANVLPAVAEQDNGGDHQHQDNGQGNHGHQGSNSNDDREQVKETALESQQTPPDVQGLEQSYISEFAIGTTTMNAHGVAIVSAGNNVSLQNATLGLKGVIYRSDEGHDMSFLEGTIDVGSTSYQVFAEGSMAVNDAKDVSNLFITGKAMTGDQAHNVIIRFLVIHDSDGTLKIIGDPAGRINPDTRLYAMLGKLTVSFSTPPPNGQGSLDHFEISGIGNQPVGQAFSFTVKAIRTDGAVMTGYNGAITLATNDGPSPRGDQPQLSPASYTFTAADNGVHSFSAMMFDAKSGVYINATGSGKSGMSNTFAVLPGQAALLTISPSPVTLAPGGLATFTAKAFDKYSNQIPEQTFLWSESSSSIGALSAGSDSSIEMLQAPATTSGASGNVTSKALDTNLTVSAMVHVNSTVVFLDHFTISYIPSNQTAGQQFGFTVTAIDNFGRIMTDFNGMVNVTSTDGTSPSGKAGAFSAQSYVFQTTDAGQHVFEATLYNAKDVVNVTAAGSGKSVTSNNFRVVPGVISTVHVTPNPLIENANATTTVNATATDAFGNSIHTGFVWGLGPSAPGTLTPAADTQSATFKAGNIHVETGGTMTVTAGGVSTVVAITVNP